MRLVHREVERWHNTRVGKRWRSRVMRMVVGAGREVHMRPVEVRHVGRRSCSMVMLVRSGASCGETSGCSGGSVRIVMMGDKTVNHSGVGMIEPT